FWMSRSETASARHRTWTAAVLVSSISLTVLYAAAKPALTSAAQGLEERYACLAHEIEHMQIRAVATDYWTFKPLYFFGGQNGAFQILQLDFRDGSPLTWLNDHRFVRGTANHIVKDLDRCEQTSKMGRDGREYMAHCSEDWYVAHLGVVSQTEVCQ